MALIGEPTGRTPIFFPLIGAILGAAGAGLYLATARVLPLSLAALLTIFFWTAISGGVHQSRIGIFGAVAIGLSVIARWQALERLATPRLLEVCIAAQTVPRAGMIALAWVSRPVGAGLGLALSATLTTPAALLAILQGAIAALVCGLRPGLAIIGGTYLILRVARWYCYRHIGGVNGNTLGALEQLLEIFVLLLFTCRSCSW